MPNMPHAKSTTSSVSSSSIAAAAAIYLSRDRDQHYPPRGALVSPVATGKIAAPHADVEVTVRFVETDENSHAKASHRYNDRRFGDAVLEGSSVLWSTAQGCTRHDFSFLLRRVKRYLTCQTCTIITRVLLPSSMHFASGSPTRPSSPMTSFLNHSRTQQHGITLNISSLKC